jgi:hypothetical protein
MNKSELVAKIAEGAELTKVQAEKALNFIHCRFTDKIWGWVKSPPKWRLVKVNENHTE